MQRFLLSMLGALALLCPNIQAEVLLTVDISDPDNVVLTATDGVPSTAVDTEATEGFTMLGFLNTDSGEAFEGTGNLAANGMDRRSI